jgi:hypothetical protein
MWTEYQLDVFVYIWIYEGMECVVWGGDRTATELCNCDEVPMMCDLKRCLLASRMSRRNRRFRLFAYTVMT